MYDQREVFPYAPLALVAAELRFVYSPRLGQQSTLDSIAIALEKLFPIVTPRLQPAGVSASRSRREMIFSLTNSRSTIGLTLSSNTVVIEATEYESFESFLAILIAVCASIEDHRGISALERVGLRYIDEIRVPSQISDVRDWRGWVADPLIDMLDVGGRLPVRTCQGVVEYSLGPDQNLAFRFAALDGEPVVGGGPLRRLKPQPPGPQFVLDVDCYWQAPIDEPISFSTDIVVSIVSALHDPTGEVFQNAITDRSRELFRGASLDG